MQTFLPYASFKRTAKVLDLKRLGKQRVEAYQIFRTLIGESEGWKNHPAVLMWKGYEHALLDYGITMCNEWISRGYSDSMKPIFESYIESYFPDKEEYDLPPWMGKRLFHNSHKSKLIQKYPSHYRTRFNKGKKNPVPEDLDYWWPTKEMKDGSD